MIRHDKILRRGDSPDFATVPKVKDWHDTHISPDFLILAIQSHGGTTGPVSGSVATEIGIGWQTRYDFTNIDRVCIEVSAGQEPTTSGEYRAQYSLDNGVTWAYFDGVNGPRVDLAPPNFGPIFRGPWITIAAAARKDVNVRIVTLNAAGTTISPGSVNVWGR